MEKILALLLILLLGGTLLYLLVTKVFPTVLSKK
jgi:hypothetical protein